VDKNVCGTVGLEGKKGVDGCKKMREKVGKSS